MYIEVNSNDNLGDYLKHKNKGNWIVWYHADWCGHCHQMASDWDNFVKKTQHKKNINLAKIQDVMLKNIKVKNKIEGYPTIRFINNGKDMSEFMEERNTENLISFTNKNIRKMKQRIQSKKKKIKRNTSNKKKRKSNKS